MMFDWDFRSVPALDRQEIANCKFTGKQNWLQSRDDHYNLVQDNMIKDMPQGRRVVFTSRRLVFVGKAQNTRTVAPFPITHAALRLFINTKIRVHLCWSSTLATCMPLVFD
jgi:small nuclear ribonucleoprotein (snRNP)-like protein